MNNWDTMNIKSELFSLFDYARELYNVYYRSDKDFNDEDLKTIQEYIKLIEENIKEVKEMI